MCQRILIWVVCFFILNCESSLAQTKDYGIDSLKIRSFFDYEMNFGKAYNNLYKLCKQYPKRLSGSSGLEGAIRFSEELMKSYGFDTVRLQPVMVPHWERGGKEEAIITLDNAVKMQLSVCALGGSIATAPDGIRGDIIELSDWDDWTTLGSSGALKGKIVFVNITMKPEMVSAFQAYGSCWNVRGSSAIEAARYGAIGIIIRSLSQTVNPYPHTGVMYYNDSITRIPAMAMSTANADELHQLLQTHKAKIWMKQSCQFFGESQSYNVMAEIKGSEFPNEYITIGGHLDAWDLGEGAHDDGTGVMGCLDALILLQKMYKPRYSIRCVFFTNEENGNRGGKAYANMAKDNNEIHRFALESDGGGFTPRGFGIQMNDGEFGYYDSMSFMLRPYFMDYLEDTGGGTDIGPLKTMGTILSDLIPDSQRYFDVHHASNDVFENVNQRELQLGAAGMAAMVYMIDKYGIAH